MRGVWQKTTLFPDLFHRNPSLMGTSFFFIYVMATSFFYIYVIATTSFFYIYIKILLNAIFFRSADIVGKCDSNPLHLSDRLTELLWLRTNLEYFVFLKPNPMAKSSEGQFQNFFFIITPLSFLELVSTSTLFFEVLGPMTKYISNHI